MPAERVYQANPSPETTIIIPSLDGSRGGNVERLIAQIKSQSYRDLEIIISKNEKPNGHARNVGIAIAAGRRYYMFFDDDVRLGHESVLANFISALSDPGIGLVGASQLPPDGSNWKQRWIGYDLGKAKFPIQEAMVDTEMATHAGMACRKEVWDEMGGETDTLITGTDTDLRDRLRKAGYRVVVAPRTWVYHPLPDSFGKVMRAAIHNGWYQLDYRKVHGFQRGLIKPFKPIRGKPGFILSLFREALIFWPHIFLANRRPALGFRPLNAAFRFLMVSTYAIRCLREG